MARIVSLAEIWRVVQGDPHPDAVVARVAGQQLTLIATPQLHAAGVGRGSIEWRGIPITATARTLIDFASTTGAEEAERAIAEAVARKLVTERQVVAAIQRAPGRAGVGLVKAILGQPGGPSRTRAGGERAMLRLIRAAQLPPPRTNLWVAGFSADFCWPEKRLIVEVDGYPFHSTRGAVECDHRRDVVHREAGYEVLRFTARQLEEEPLYVATVIARPLDRRSRARG